MQCLRVVLLLLSVFLVKMRTSDARWSSSQQRKGGDQGSVRALESSLLGMLGLRTVPNRPRRQVRVPEYMLDLYRYRTAHQQQSAAASGSTGKSTALGFHLGGTSATTDATVRSFLSAATQVGDIHKDLGGDSNPDNSLHLWFNVSTLPGEERLKASELRLYRPRFQGAHKWCHRGLHLQVFDVLSRPGRDTQLRLIDTRAVDFRQAGWESFDVLPAVLRWREDSTSNHGLQVRVVRNDGSEGHARFGRALSRTMSSAEDRQPLLVTYSDDGRSTASPARSKRSPRKHRRKGRKENCRRHSLYVDFSDVGWNDWIVAPPGYQAYYCNGECPFPLGDHLNSTNHAIVQTLMNSVHQTSVPRACCVPTELSAISMLYVDEYDKVVLKNYQDMVVEGCGCR